MVLTEEQRNKARARYKRWSERNKEKLRAIRREYHEKNKDRINSRKREYMKTYNHSSAAKKSRKMYSNSIKGKIARKKRWKKYQQSPKWKSYKKSYSHSYWKTARGKAIKAKENGRRRAITKETDISSSWLLQLSKNTMNCVVCLKPLGNDRHLDHIKPLVVGGTHTMNNVRYIHTLCNLKRPHKG